MRIYGILSLDLFKISFKYTIDLDIRGFIDSKKMVSFM